MESLTDILAAAGAGDTAAAERLLPLVYDELRKLAACRLAQEPSGQTLEPTALVHEAYLRLVAAGPVEWNGRGHFFGAAAEAMRRILVNRARGKLRLKRGGGWRRVELNDLTAPQSADDEALVLLDEALERLAATHPEAAQLVNLRFFGGLTAAQAAAAMEIAPRSADRLWAYARAWLYRACQEEVEKKGPPSEKHGARGGSNGAL